MQSAISRRLSAARSLCRRIDFDESGSVMSFLAVVPVLTVGVVCFETGQLYVAKRQMQIAADAAALAASVDSVAGKSSSVVAATALYEAQRNGFTNGVNGVTVSVHSPPTSGSFQSSSIATEVIVQKAQGYSLGTMLFNMLSKSSPSVVMKARAVATQITTTSNLSNACIIALTDGNEQGISMTNFNTFGSDCSILSNATATGSTSTTSAFDMSTFNNGTIHNDANNAVIWTRGSFTQTSRTGSALVADAILQNRTMDTLYDPYAVGNSKALPTPSPGGCTYTNYSPPNDGNVTLSPGTYCGGLTVQNKTNVYFTPGTYYIADGDLIISADQNVRCPSCGTSGGVTTGVTFVLTTTGSTSNIGGVSMTSENNVTLNAPSTGIYAGVLFYQDRRATTGTTTSSSKIFTVASLNNATLSGLVYFPQNRIDISTINNVGGSSTTGCTIWIGRYIKFSSYNNNYKGGCSTYNTTPAGVTTTTTANKIVWDPA
jgi:Flp pilus assembly protein TadG